MAIFYPPIESIDKLKIIPKGEKHALKVLSGLDDKYEVFFQPFINGHNPDIIVMRKGYGVLVIEVKDWVLDRYNINQDSWSLKKNGSSKKSPIKQVETYKNDLYSLSIPSLLEKKIDNRKYYGIVQTLVYFHYATKSSIQQLNIECSKYCPVYGNDNFSVKYLSKDQFSLREYPNILFSDEIYEKFLLILKPSKHLIEQGEVVVLDRKQAPLAISRPGRQKIKGRAGSGKSLVLARRAVNAHLRTNSKVLILTYNITLKNYLHDQISRVRGWEDWSNFYINHFHAFMKTEANNHNIILDEWSDFEDENIFEDVKGRLNRYETILIDEIQDYHLSWQRIIEKYFLEPGGELVVFGDEKQNIYDNELDGSQIKTTIPSGWNKLDEQYRMGGILSSATLKFQEVFLASKYEIDKPQGKLHFEKGSITYYQFDDSLSISDLSQLIVNTIKTKKIQQQDLCVISHTNELLREIDYRIRKDHNYCTFTTFETREILNILQQQHDKDKKALDAAVQEVRRNKRFNFWMNSPGMKMSTVHSFKGWGIDSIFLIIGTEETIETDELIYTALTRCRKNLYVININKGKYHEFFIGISDTHEVKSSEGVESPNLKENSIRVTVQKQNPERIIGVLGRSGSFPYNILVLGEISGSQKDYKVALNDYFSKLGIDANMWSLDFWNNKSIKKKNIKSLRKGQSKYDLLITAQLHHHSSAGNSKENLLTELMSSKYVRRIYGSKSPKKLLTVDGLVNALDVYLNRSD